MNVNTSSLYAFGVLAAISNRLGGRLDAAGGSMGGVDAVARFHATSITLRNTLPSLVSNDSFGNGQKEFSISQLTKIDYIQLGWNGKVAFAIDGITKTVGFRGQPCRILQSIRQQLQDPFAMRLIHDLRSSHGRSPTVDAQTAAKAGSRK